MVDALAAALSLREVRTVNMVMVGAASRFLPLPEEAYEKALKASLPERMVAVNVDAFRAGRSLLPPAKLRPDVYTVRGGDR
jgi:indolepyruvate ferredoxin oxidoreductase beta subunit